MEAQTRKLFKVCVMRHIPIFTFINKMDRDANDTFDLLDEIERCALFIFAWILKTNAEKSSENGLISPTSAVLGSGEVVIFKKCCKNVSTPKFVNAEPKNTGESSPFAKRKMRLSQPQQMMAQERKIIEEAYAGDIIGVVDPFLQTNIHFIFIFQTIFQHVKLQNAHHAQINNCMKRK